ncbi:MAG: M28 family metallopeptidase [Aeromicrobium sp.]
MRPLLPALALVCAVVTSCGDEAGPKAPPDRFDSAAAMTLLEEQVALGPRPAGSDASRRLADRLRSELPDGRFQEVPGGLRNVIGTVEGRDPQRTVVVGAHYDTKDEPGFVGANDGASGTAVVLELARHLEPRELRPTIVFAFFDGEESPRGSEDFARDGMRGSAVAAEAFDEAEAMILLDYVGDRDLSIPREANSDPALWEKLRAAAKRAGHDEYFPSGQVKALLDDHVQFTARGVPSIDLIDFTFDCFHQPCDDLSAVSEQSLDATGETVLELLRSL